MTRFKNIPSDCSCQQRREMQRVGFVQKYGHTWTYSFSIVLVVAHYCAWCGHRLPPEEASG